MQASRVYLGLGDFDTGKAFISEYVGGTVEGSKYISNFSVEHKKHKGGRPGVGTR